MKPQDIIVSIVNASITKVARDAGFKKYHLNFFRRKGTVIQVINVQLSPWNRGLEAYFYINIALEFDELRTHEGKPIIEMPKEYQCDFRRRIEHLVPETSFAWEVTPEVDADSVALKLHQSITVVLDFLNQIDSLSTFLNIATSEKWFALPGEYDFLARLYDALGDTEEAEKNRRLFNEFLHNRETMSSNEFLVYYGFPPVPGIPDRRR
ncbi:MAG: DUF4304 domain-containing protein [Candidatus Eiseniibacteriota bacterium]